MENFNINTDEFYYKQKVKIEIEIEPYKLFLVTSLLVGIINKDDFIEKSLTETGLIDLKNIAQLLMDKCGEAQELLRKQRGN
jgi:hypothetical protein